MNDPVTLPRRQLRGLYRAVVGFFVATVLLGGPLVVIAVQQQATNDHQTATDRRLAAVIAAEERDDRAEEAQRCVSSWEVREQIRASDRTHALASAEALIEVVNPDDPAIVDLYRAVLDRRLAEAGEQVGDPDCDLDRARAVLSEE